MRPFAFFFLIGILSFTGCAFSDLIPDEDQVKPVDVTWTGQVRDGYQNIPLPNQEVILVESKIIGPPGGRKLYFFDTVLTTRTDEQGYFSFQYSDPNDRCCWHSIHTIHPDYMNSFEELKNHPAIENYEKDLVLKPKAWLKIRVLDIPEQTISQTGISFINLNVDANFWPLSTHILRIWPSNGDTTFYAFKPGGELTAFAYYNSDSMGTVSYEAIFPPFDTTELTFTY